MFDKEMLKNILFNAYNQYLEDEDRYEVIDRETFDIGHLGFVNTAFSLDDLAPKPDAPKRIAKVNPSGWVPYLIGYNPDLEQVMCWVNTDSPDGMPDLVERVPLEECIERCYKWSQENWMDIYEAKIMNRFYHKLTEEEVERKKMIKILIQVGVSDPEDYDPKSDFCQKLKQAYEETTHVISPYDIDNWIYAERIMKHEITWKEYLAIANYLEKMCDECQVMDIFQDGMVANYTWKPILESILKTDALIKAIDNKEE